MDIMKLLKEFRTLDKFKKMELYKLIRLHMFPDNTKLGDFILDLRETRFSEGIYCPHCDSKKVKRNGKYRSRQRYLCKVCGKSFNDMTATPIAGTHYPQRWLSYFECMVQGLSLREIAKQLDIHLSTAFYWRHKILNALRAIGNEQLKGIVESDETFFLESNKGIKHVETVLGRKARKRGGKSKYRGISHEQICVVVALDRTGRIITQTAGRGRITSTQIDAVLGDYLKDASILCTDSATNYSTFARKKGLVHEKVNASKKVYVRKAIYHIQHVNAYHRRLKDWMEHFNGVATKYLDNYLFWFKFLEQFKQMGTNPKKQKMLILSCVKPNKTTVQMLRIA